MTVFVDDKGHRAITETITTASSPPSIPDNRGATDRYLRLSLGTSEVRFTR